MPIEGRNIQTVKHHIRNEQGMNRRILLMDPAAGRWRLETLQVETLKKDPREDYFILSGETLCQYLLRRDAKALVIARGPLPFLAGNKATVGYISPLTGLPHYSFVGGRGALQLLNLGLDAICFQGEGTEDETPYIVISGRAPDLRVEFRPSDELPSGQRGAFYHLQESGNRQGTSIFTVGEGARLGYRSANLAVEGIYHAGRGGAGYVFARFASALVLRGRAMSPSEFFAGDETVLFREPVVEIPSLLDKHCARLSGKAGGTIVKLLTTGADPSGHNTLPAWNARRLGYPLADLGGPRVLKATRQGQTGCHWCEVKCRHWHWVSAEYAPGGRDIFLDDFEPAYALFAMLGLIPAENTFKAQLDLLEDVNRHVILPIEEMGCDVIDIGLGLAALFEGVGRGIIPPGDIPDSLAAASGLGDSPSDSERRRAAAAEVLDMLRSGHTDNYPALRAVGDSPQALADRYPAMQDIVFTGGKGTFGNAGHCNALWTFLMPFSRFFGHYVGQYYKISEELPPAGSGGEAYRTCFERVVRQLLEREFFWLLCNALSQCAFTFVIFSQSGKGERLSDDDLLVRLLESYGIRATRADLAWFGGAFWAQSIDLKGQFGWRPPSAADFPSRIYEGLSLTLNRPPEELRDLMDLLILEWKRQAGDVLSRFGYDTPW